MTVPEIDAAQVARFKQLILLTCGLSLENGRETTLREALRERMATLDQPSFDAYFGVLQADAGEFAQLVERLTVNETYFLREPAHLRLAIQHLVPDLLASRSGPVRFLCAGCSTGEEPYSLAILLRERYGDNCGGMFTIAAVDIDGAAIAAARRGVYGRNSFRGTDPELLARHFDPLGDGQFSIREPLRRLVTFEQVNLLAPGFPPLMQRSDIILYRNVSIYFPKPVQGQVFRGLSEVLCENGYLIVGATETLPHDLGVLALVAREGLFVFRKQLIPVSDRREARRPATRAPVLPGPPPVLRVPPGPRPAPVPVLSGKLRTLFDAALEHAHADRGEPALRILDELLHLDGAFLKAHSLKACVLMNGGQHQQARQACARALELDAMCLEAYLMLGVIARSEDQDDLARQRFREAMYLDPDCWLAHYHLAEIHFLKGERSRARAGYESALRILQDPALLKRGRSLFPLSFKAETFVHICRHKLALIKGEI